MLVGLLERAQRLTAKAVVGDCLDGALDARLVLGVSHPRGVDDEAARLRILGEAVDESRMEWVSLFDVNGPREPRNSDVSPV
jgi:hypothetical protein